MPNRFFSSHACGSTGMRFLFSLAEIKSECRLSLLMYLFSFYLFFFFLSFFLNLFFFLFLFLFFLCFRTWGLGAKKRVPSFTTQHADPKSKLEFMALLLYRSIIVFLSILSCHYLFAVNQCDLKFCFAPIRIFPTITHEDFIAVQ